MIDDWDYKKYIYLTVCTYECITSKTIEASIPATIFQYIVCVQQVYRKYLSRSYCTLQSLFTDSRGLDKNPHLALYICHYTSATTCHPHDLS